MTGAVPPPDPAPPDLTSKALSLLVLGASSIHLQTVSIAQTSVTASGDTRILSGLLARQIDRSSAPEKAVAGRGLVERTNGVRSHLGPITYLQQRTTTEGHRTLSCLCNN